MEINESIKDVNMSSSPYRGNFLFAGHRCNPLPSTRDSAPLRGDASVDHQLYIHPLDVSEHLFSNIHVFVSLYKGSKRFVVEVKLDQITGALHLRESD